MIETGLPGMPRRIHANVVQNYSVSLQVKPTGAASGAISDLRLRGKKIVFVSVQIKRQSTAQATGLGN